MSNTGSPLHNRQPRNHPTDVSPIEDDIVQGVDENSHSVKQQHVPLLASADTTREEPGSQQIAQPSDSESDQTRCVEAEDASPQSKLSAVPAATADDMQATISSPPRSATVTPSSSLLAEWCWEIFTWALGTLAVALMLLIFGIFRNKPYDYWHSSVQMATVIAALSQLAQSALIVSVSACIGQSKWTRLRKRQNTIEVERYDEASRGPGGSLKFLVFYLGNSRSRGAFAVQG
jgi:hypothetical protein